MRLERFWKYQVPRYECIFTDRLKVPPDKKTSWGKRERYSFGYAVFLILALMK